MHAPKDFRFTERKSAENLQLLEKRESTNTKMRRHLLQNVVKIFRECYVEQAKIVSFWS